MRHYNANTNYTWVGWYILNPGKKQEPTIFSILFFSQIILYANHF
jgi:hypothetical protein